MAAARTFLAASRTVEAGVDRVWAVLVRPDEHRRFDASGMVGRSVGTPVLADVGAVFTMQMSYDDGRDVEHYRTDNHVTRYERETCLEWAVAPEGGEPLGWRWRYELADGAAGGTLVTLTYDWAGTTPRNVRRYGVPLVDAAGLARSLDLLAAAVEPDAPARDRA